MESTYDIFIFGGIAHMIYVHVHLMFDIFGQKTQGSTMINLFTEWIKLKFPKLARC